MPTLIDALRRHKPTHIRTNSADSNLSAALTELSSAASDSPPSLSPTSSFTAEDIPALEAKHSDSGTDMTALVKLNGTLLAALKAERERSRALLQRLEQTEDTARVDKEESATEAITTEPSANPRPASAGTRLRGPLRTWTSNSSNEQLAAPAKAAPPRKPRKRVVVDPLGAPLRAGSLIEPHDLTVRTTSPPSSAREDAAEDCLVSTAWPEPSCSPPCRRAAKPRTNNTNNTSGAVAAGLSAALATRLRRSLSDELNRLQELLQTTLTSSSDKGPEEQVISALTRRLGWLRADLTVLASHESTPAKSEAAAAGSEAFGSLLEVASAVEEFAISLRAEIRSKARAEAERKHAVELCQRAGLEVHEVAHDGDCLFSCAHRWAHMAAASTDKGSATKLPRADDDEIITDVSDKLASAQKEEGATEEATDHALADVAAMCTSAADMRGLVVDLMRERASGAASAAAGLLDTALASAMVAMVVEAARCRASDGTSVAMRVGLAQRGVSVSGASVGGSQREACLEVYLEAMATKGIYGERLEIDAISALLGRPVHIYYYEGQGEAADEPAAEASLAPREKIVHDGVASDAEPLRLLHLVHERHFTLLTPQKPRVVV